MNIQSILFSGAWFCLIDGIVQSHVNGGGSATAPPPPFMWFYALPAFFVTLTNILMNVVDKKQVLHSSNSVFSDSSGNKKATAWFIFMLAGSMCCIGGKIKTCAPAHVFIY
jgi:hypothetical protein